jgi:hypothetical protein
VEKNPFVVSGDVVSSKRSREKRRLPDVALAAPSEKKTTTRHFAPTTRPHFDVASQGTVDNVSRSRGDAARRDAPGAPYPLPR